MGVEMIQYHCYCGNSWTVEDKYTNVVTQVNALCAECQKYGEASGIPIKTDRQKAKEEILARLAGVIEADRRDTFPTGLVPGMEYARQIIEEME